jgi:hypothetical protein
VLEDVSDDTNLQESRCLERTYSPKPDLVEEGELEGRDLPCGLTECVHEFRKALVFQISLNISSIGILALRMTANWF